MWRSCLVVYVFLAFGCADPALLDATEACPCLAEDSCGSDHCSYAFRLADSCKGSVKTAEVWIDGHLEASLITLGQAEPMVPCTRTAPGETAELFVRGGSWLWGSEDPDAAPGAPMTIACLVPGFPHERSFECQEKGVSGPAVDDL